MSHIIQIIYIGTKKPNLRTLPKEQTFLFLTYDNWDDYDQKTSFKVAIYKDGNLQKIGDLKLAIYGFDVTADYLNQLPEISDIGCEIDIAEDQTYLSLGQDRGYYTNLKERLNALELDYVLKRLHDVLYLEHREARIKDLLFRKERIFRDSILRSYSALEAYETGKEIIFPEEMAPNRFNFDFTYHLEHAPNPHRFGFDFVKEPFRPTSINVLVGKNGAGKSQALYHLVDFLLEERVGHWERRGDWGFTPLSPRPPIKHVVAISFSALEHFPLSIRDAVSSQVIDGSVIAESPNYTYCGLRNGINKPGREVAWTRTLHSLLEILNHDLDQEGLHKALERPKFSYLLKTLEAALSFEGVLVKIRSDYELPATITSEARVHHNGDQYLDVSYIEYGEERDFILAITEGRAEDRLAFKAGNVVQFFSAGQETFIFMVFGAIAGLKENSLIVIDEPELYLHPNLEIEYLKMLRMMLTLFSSIAIVATHSAFIVRELPSKCVHIVSLGEDGEIFVEHPAIESYGADITDIANLIFDNLLVEKPFEKALRRLIKETDGNYEKIVEEYGTYLTPETLTFILNEIDEPRGSRRNG